jgi:hypothetical protein
MQLPLRGPVTKRALAAIALGLRGKRRSSWTGI